MLDNHAGKRADIEIAGSWQQTAQPQTWADFDDQLTQRPPVVVHVQAPPTAASHWRGVVIGMCMVGAFALIWKLIDALAQTDGLGIALGISLGALAGIPTALLLLAAARQGTRY